jgi:hypothetical protein
LALCATLGSLILHTGGTNSRRPGLEPKEAKDAVARSYCVRSIICVEPTVLTARSIDVSGGNKLGALKRWLEVL